MNIGHVDQDQRKPFKIKVTTRNLKQTLSVGRDLLPRASEAGVWVQPVSVLSADVRLQTWFHVLLVRNTTSSCSSIRDLIRAV